MDVSIIMPTYNRAHSISDSIRSILAQTYPDFELIIVDDGSTDSTEAVINSFCDPRILCIKQPNQGVSSARNTGISRARGDYIAFCDSDDILEPFFLEFFIRQAQKFPHIDFFYADAYWENVQQVVSSVAPRFIPYVQGVGTCTMFVRKNPLVCFDSAIKDGLEEWFMLLCMYKRVRFKHLKKRVSFVRLNDDARILGNRDEDYIAQQYQKVALKHMLTGLSPRPRLLVIIKCRDATSDKQRFCALNHYRLFLKGSYDLALDVSGMEDAATLKYLRAVGLKILSSREDIVRHIQTSRARIVFQTLDSIVINKYFKFGRLNHAVRYYPWVVAAGASSVICKCFLTSYSPNPLIVESFRCDEGDRTTDSEVFLCTSKTYLQGEGESRITEAQLLHL